MTNRGTKRALVLGAAVAALAMAGWVSGVGAQERGQAQTASSWQNITNGIAVLRPFEGSGLQGTVLFHQTEHGLRVVAELAGLKPGLEYCLHIRRYGDLSTGSGEGLGEGYPGKEQDLLGIVTGAPTGRAHLDKTFTGLSLAQTGREPVLARGLSLNEVMVREPLAERREAKPMRRSRAGATLPAGAQRESGRALAGGVIGIARAR